MITIQDKKLIINLMNNYADNVSTEAMIAFVANTNGMLSVCRTLVRRNNNDGRLTITWVDEQCHERKVDVRGFLFEVERILSIFQPDHPDKQAEEYYDALGLQSGANDEEIKRAHRKLSKKFHPDTATQIDAGNDDMFVKITQAYQVLIARERGNSYSSPSVNHWREEKKNYISWELKKKNLFWFAVLALVMIVMSLIVASNYQKRAMIAGLQSRSIALIPPVVPVIEEEQDDDELISVEEKIVKPEIAQSDSKVDQVECSVKRVVPPPPLPLKLPLVSDNVTLKFKDKVAERKDKVAEQISQSKSEGTAYKEKDFLEKSTERKIVPVKQVPSLKISIQELGNGEPIKKTGPVLLEIVEEAKKINPEHNGVAPKTKVVSVVILEENTKQIIDTFFADYIKSYTDKDVLSLARFFDLKATENGKSLDVVLPVYEELFQTSEMISLTISILEWEKSGESIQVNGRFIFDVEYKNGQKFYGRGAISFHLLNIKGQFFIKETNYKFDS